MAQFAFNHAEQYVCNDTFVLRELGLNIQPAQMFFQEVEDGKWFIPNCVDTNTFRRTKGLDKLKNLNPILFPRNLTPPRGADLAIKAFNKFVKKYPETNLIIVGDSIPDMASSLQYKDELKALVNELRLVKKVHFWGNVDRKLMPDIYSSSLLTLIPTLCSEGTSFSALESMACGTATISTNIEGLLDLPTLHCRADVEDLSRAMEEAFENCGEVGLQQQKKVREIYNRENWQKAWLKVIEKAFEGN
jgi:glycosyltransferase involved in cell wall biosynthesis